MKEAPTQPTATDATPLEPPASHRSGIPLPVVAACGCGSGCTCGCKSGGSCRCGGGCG
ncbi:hypothetical protein [Streptacidiphilus sp. ASG 303]|uniref:hypothetical protein n=1 Tax=Streptomycetaceae TaxID=2062 RepID=UPI001E5DD7FF|nr:hypothetical protein [Streptacidiphilus sp. ASG 303]MCD0485555.1 hypothetical protein [Streptacidiphilus sp. ASG 303]